jgi:hypothetical protein
MLGVEFLVRVAMEFSDPGVLMAFEETPGDIATSVASLASIFRISLARKNCIWIL